MSKPFAIVTGASSGIGLELAAILRARRLRPARRRRPTGDSRGRRPISKPGCGDDGCGG